MKEQPIKTNVLAQSLCTTDEIKNRTNPEEFIHIYVENFEKLREFLEHIVEKIPDSKKLI